MKKFLLTLALVAFAATSMTAQVANKQCEQVKKECCKDHKDGQKCDKPADQQCPDCKAKAAKQECKKTEGQKCEKAEGMKHECKKGEGHECEKGMAPKHECKEGMQKCEKAEGMKHECKDHKDGQACNKPADQQCPDCKDKAKKN